MCDKKNSVLFIETECLILSFDFKLLNESQILLKVPRQNNMYSFYLKNVVPSGGLTCLFAKATIDKDETPEILKNFITGIENQIDHKVKAIKCDNGTEFKNRIMNEFCEMKDSKLPITFCAEVVNTTCYVQNRLLVIKPHNKTPCELFLGRKHALSFMRPFGCHVTILNTLDHLSKFDGKSDDGFFVGYSINSKAFIVFNTRTKIVEENLHINFLENKPNVAGTGLNWMFDIDTLTMSMNYQPIFAGNQTNGHASTKANFDAGQARKKTSSEDEVADNARKKNEVLDPAKKGDMNGQEEAANTNSTNRLNNVSSSVKTVSPTFTTIFTPVSVVGSSYDNLGGSISVNAATLPNGDLPTDPLMPELEDTVDLHDTGIFRGVYDDEDVGAKANLNNLETTMNVSPIPITRIHKDQPKNQIIGDINLTTQTRRMTKISEEHAMIDVKSAFLYGTIEEEVYVCQPPSFEDLQFPNKVYNVEKALYGLHQAPRAWYETLSTYLLQKGFRRGIIDKTLFIKKDKVKRIFRYLKDQLKLGLWVILEDLTILTLEAFSDSDYAGASLDRKSTIGAEYVAAANCYGQVLWIQNQMLDYGFNFMNTKIYTDNESTICIMKNPVFHSKTKHIEIRYHFIRDSYEKKLIQVIKIHTDHNVADLLIKAFDVSRFALSKYPTIYDSHIKQFWQTATVNTLDNEEQEITTTVDGHVKTVTIASVRKYLKLADVGGLSSLPNTKFFEQLSLMGEEIPLFPTMLAIDQPGQGEATFIGVNVVHGGVATNISSIDARQGGGNIPKSPTMPYDSPLPGGHTSRSDEGSLPLHEMTVLCEEVGANVETSQDRRRAKIVVSDEEEDEEDPSKQGRSLIEEIDLDARISLVPPQVSIFDVEVAQKLQEEFDAAERQRMAQVHQAAQGFTDAEWDDVLARVIADEDLVQ
ncbi:putative ribonuclease H-like domain-containing protein [Tanacetum coccineum]